mmetsp:Transcript_25749/g.58629  ORF Transcript_25749/g.58629 Transcript_25749/m.58629 type:complete len:99 (+) Transcript_25749:328-624(+)
MIKPIIVITFSVIIPIMIHLPFRRIVRKIMLLLLHLIPLLLLILAPRKLVILKRLLLTEVITLLHFIDRLPLNECHSKRPLKETVKEIKVDFAPDTLD